MRPLLRRGLFERFNEPAIPVKRIHASLTGDVEVGVLAECAGSSGDDDMPFLALAAILAIGTPADVRSCQWIGQL